jgi:preprotein translocase subunit SecA
VTVATNMAGRGTDIVLGGNPEMIARLEILQSASEQLQRDLPALEKAIADATEQYVARCNQEREEVLAAGGLHILGTERHESRRVDNQLRGRSGRQGDPGSSRFYLSLEDDLMRIFAGERIQGLMGRLGMEEGVPIEHKWVTRAVENAQTKVEQRNFDIRKHLLEYDDVMNQQRKSVYALRRQVLRGQYRTEPTEEQRKKGVESERMVKQVDPILAEEADPRLEELIKECASEPLSEDASPDERAIWIEQALGREINDLKQLDTQQLEQKIYIYFGCQVDLARYATEPAKALEYLRQEVPMSLTEQRERLFDLLDEIIGTMVEHACPLKKHYEDWNIDGLIKAYEEQFGISATGIEKIIDSQEMAAKLFRDAEAVLKRREQEIGRLLYLRLFRNFYLQDIDNQWLEHLQDMDSLREGIGLRGYGQRDPKKEYQKEGFSLFLDLMQNVKAGVVHKMFHFRLESEDEVARLEEQRRRRVEAQQQRIRMSHMDATGEGLGEEGAGGRGRRPRRGGYRQQTVRRDKPKVRRNDPCPCGSGKKYKNCCLRSDQAQQSADISG